jgi:DNA-binding response OmpR family regulator
MDHTVENAVPLRLLIADDAADVTEVVAFGARIVWPDCIVDTASSGQAALEHFAEAPADLVILDVAMPPPDGFEVCRRIREVSQVPILMLTVRDATLDKVRALELGADDYLTKPYDHLELLARLRALVRRSRTLAMPSLAPTAVRQNPDQDHSRDENPFVLGEFLFDYAAREVYMGSARIALTGTEYRLLEELVRNAGTVLSHRQLLERVWGPEYLGDTHYLKVFVQRLRDKLHDDPQHARYIHTEWGRGYRFATRNI